MRSISLAGLLLHQKPSRLVCTPPIYHRKHRIYLPASHPVTAAKNRPANAEAVVKIGESDFYLHEDHQIKRGDYVTNPFTEWLDKATKATTYQDQYHFKRLSITTQAAVSPAQGWDQHKFFYSWYSALLYGHEATGWGEFSFASDYPAENFSPFRMTPVLINSSDPDFLTDAGTSFTEDAPVYYLPAQANYRVTRTTNLGTIVVDTSDNTFGFSPAIP